jgi:ABC-2 type transport system ATP-binding protein
MIEVKGITKFYGAFKALDNVSFHVDKGEVLGFLGPNGAGKSTTMKVLTTYISASEGTASVAGYDVKRVSAGSAPTHRLPAGNTASLR